MGVEPHKLLASQSHQDLSDSRFILMSPNPSLWSISEIILGHHYAPKVVELPCARIGDNLSFNRKGMTDLMGGVRFKEGYPDFKQHDGNLSHKGSSSIKDTYLAMSEFLLSVDQAHPEYSIIAPTGTVALWGAVSAAHKYAHMKGYNRKGIVCSEGAHQWSEEIGVLVGEYQLTHKVVIDGFNCDMQTDILLEKLLKHRPAALVLAAGRTDDGFIESLDPEVEKFCLENDLPVIVDGCASTPYSFYPDIPLKEDFAAPNLKQRYLSLLKSPAVKFVVNGWGKFIGPHSFGSVFLVHADDNQILCDAAAKIFHFGASNEYYKKSGGHFAGWTNSDSNADEACATIAALGPWYIRYMVLHARAAAIELHDKFVQLGIKCENVNTPSLVIPLGSYEEALRMQSGLSDSHNIDVALTLGCGPGIRIVFNAGVAFSEQDKQRLINAIYKEYPGTKNKESELPSIEKPYNAPFRMAIIDKHIRSIAAFYNDDSKDYLLFEPQSKRESVLEAIRMLHIIELKFGIDTTFFRSAIYDLAEYLVGDKNRKRRSNAIDSLKMFNQLTTSSTENNLLLVELKVLARHYKLFTHCLSLPLINHEMAFWNLIDKTFKFGEPYEDQLIKEDKLIPMIFDTDSLSEIERDPLFQNRL